LAVHNHHSWTFKIDEEKKRREERIMHHVKIDGVKNKSTTIIEINLIIVNMALFVHITTRYL